MNSEKDWMRRVALIATLVEKAPGTVLGRTAIMKLAYFLQVLRGVPLGYDFRLYSYGPFDADVLDDLSYARSCGAISEKTVVQSHGYRYDITPGQRRDRVQKQGSDWLAEHRDAIDWVVGEFGLCSASELELVSTIVFVDRENSGDGRRVTVKELAARVREVKPHFPPSYVLTKCKEAFAKQFLLSVTDEPDHREESGR